eukprot:CAMPEP_0116978204 /NCGR_PEP_ID=MMETSP0467-20121206/57631_1 /TAXON_ID=283647 /ORGANISM="Mesodinium pulex, Strain SPMC105" /LENGTH=163 /DNA_ID=CAMNT_0004671507 /DNA_START=652 /DNA_END=1144 /DNA_ORIENTATION=-
MDSIKEWAENDIKIQQKYALNSRSKRYKRYMKKIFDLSSANTKWIKHISKLKLDTKFWTGKEQFEQTDDGLQHQEQDKLDSMQFKQKKHSDSDSQADIDDTPISDINMSTLNINNGNGNSNEDEDDDEEQQRIKKQRQRQRELDRMIAEQNNYTDDNVESTSI